MPVRVILQLPSQTIADEDAVDFSCQHKENHFPSVLYLYSYHYELKPDLKMGGEKCVFCISPSREGMQKYMVVSHVVETLDNIVGQETNSSQKQELAYQSQSHISSDF